MESSIFNAIEEEYDIEEALNSWRKSLDENGRLDPEEVMNAQLLKQDFLFKKFNASINASESFSEINKAQLEAVKSLLDEARPDKDNTFGL